MDQRLAKPHELAQTYFEKKRLIHGYCISGDVFQNELNIHAVKYKEFPLGGDTSALSNLLQIQCFLKRRQNAFKNSIF